jgi:hypothetical protein
MALRILSGILMTRASEGRATLGFEPHEASGDAWLVLPRELGPPGPFRTEPVTFFAQRELCPESGASAKIDEHSLSPRLVEVGWRGLREISYLVIGEVAD